MEKGQIVFIYQKPFTSEEFEGKAILIKRVPVNRDSRTVENWKVKFLSDGFICERLINLKNQ